MSSWFTTWWKIAKRWWIEIQIWRIEIRIARRIKKHEQLPRRVRHEELGEWFE